MKIAINGLGRIGRIFLRQTLEASEFDIVAVNDLGSKENLLYLLEHDTVYGKFDYRKFKEIDKIKFLNEKDPARLPWGDLDVDVVLESTGVFASYEKAKAHLDAGAKRVVLSAPAPKDDEQAKTFTPNVGTEFAELSKITSNASCTTNAVTPVASIMAKNPGIKKAILCTIHGYTSTQSLVDGPNKKDFRRGRAAAMNMIPTSTGAAVATEKAFPKIKGKFDGVAIRIPLIAGSLIDFTFISERETTVEEINNILKSASKEKEWEGIFSVVEEPVVSVDMLGQSYGSIADLSLTRVVDGDLVKIFSWYDNEWGYCAMLLKHIKQLENLL